MKFDKQMIEIKNLPALLEQFKANIKTTNPVIEKIRCIFGYQDSTIIYVYSAFDFIDKYETIISNGKLEKFYVYQLIDRKSISWFFVEILL